MKEFLQGAAASVLVTAVIITCLLAISPEGYGRWLAKIDISYEAAMDSYYNP